MPNDPRERLRAVAAARYLGVSRSTLAKWRMKGVGPPHHRCGPRIVYYYKDEIDAWLTECDSQASQVKSGRAFDAEV
jgi:predicted DNA-binding transcriptional regulator AlpA